MKKTIILSSIVLASASVLVGCSKYSSKEQAMDACKEWEAKAEVIRYKSVINGITENLFNSNRTCYDAVQDNQVIGYYRVFDDDRAKEGKVLKDSDSPRVKGKNEKYFRY